MLLFDRQFRCLSGASVAGRHEIACLMETGKVSVWTDGPTVDHSREADPACAVIGEFEGWQGAGPKGRDNGWKTVEHFGL